MTREIQEQAERLVRNEVHCCMTFIIDTLAKSYGENTDNKDLGEMVEQALEVLTPIPDYEEAARQEGWRTADLTPGRFLNMQSIEDGVVQETFDASSDDLSEAWQELCEKHRIEPYEREVFEAWSVSSWLARKLEERGERIVRDFGNHNIWGRSTTGQAIAMDRVIEEIAQDVINREIRASGGLKPL